MPTRAPAICAAFVHTSVHENSNAAGSFVSCTVCATMHHRMIPATSVPNWAHAFAKPPAPFQMSGSSKKPAADSGSAIRYTDPKPGWLFTSKAGNNRAAITAACVISAVNWNVPSGMASDIESCSMRPLMNARIDVPSTGRHSTDNAPLNTGAENSSSMGSRAARHWRQNATEAKNSSAPAGSMSAAGSSVTTKYTIRLSPLLKSTNRYTRRKSNVPEKRAHNRLISASPAPKHKPPATSHGTSSFSGTNSANRKAMRVTMNPVAATPAHTRTTAVENPRPDRRANAIIAAYTTMRAAITATRNSDCTMAPDSPNEVSTVGDSNDM